MASVTLTTSLHSEALKGNFERVSPQSSFGVFEEHCASGADRAFEVSCPFCTDGNGVDEKGFGASLLVLGPAAITGRDLFMRQAPYLPPPKPEACWRRAWAPGTSPEGITESPPLRGSLKLTNWAIERRNKSQLKREIFPICTAKSILIPFSL